MNTRAAVLITGEVAHSKSLIARAVALLPDRRTLPLVTLGRSDPVLTDH
jgi:transcriptional regulator with GAF, ATPase, and Fis domain